MKNRTYRETKTQGERTRNKFQAAKHDYDICFRLDTTNPLITQLGFRLAIPIDTCNFKNGL